MHDRRRQKRFKVKENVFAVLHSDLIKVIPLIDLSLDGLAFEDSMDGEPRQLGPVYGMDVFCADDDEDLVEESGIQNIQFEIVSERDIVIPDTTCMHKGKRCSVRFRQLSFDQRSHLEYFLNHNAIFEA